MDILDQILDAQKGSRDEKVENFKSLFAEEDNVAVKSALAKAKQVEEMEKLKSKHEQEIEALQKRHDRDNDRLKGAKETEVERDAIDKKREALRKANEEVDLEEGKYVSGIQDVIDVIMKKINIQVGKEIKKNQEKGLGMLNTLGSFVGHKVTDKSQEKGKLFLKFGEEVEEGYYSDKDKKQKATLKKHDKRMIKISRDSIKKYEKGRKEETEVEEDRDYKKEYENYQGKPEQIKRRAKRNEARRMLKNRKGIKGKDVHHKDNNPMNNDKSNLSIVSQKYNRTEPRLRTEKLWKDFIKGVKE